MLTPNCFLNAKTYQLKKTHPWVTCNLLAASFHLWNRLSQSLPPSEAWWGVTPATKGESRCPMPLHQRYTLLGQNPPHPETPSRHLIWWVRPGWQAQFEHFLPRDCPLFS